jgi:hypothetical protein
VSAALRHVEPLRALEILASVPPGCSLHMARDDANAPHVRAGEFVVVDGADREPSNGELFLIQFGTRPDQQCVMETRLRHYESIGQPRNSLDEPTVMAPGWAWMMHPLNRPRSFEETAARIRSGKPMWSRDGPCYAEYLRTILLGRVIGIFQAPADAVPLRLSES